MPEREKIKICLVASSLTYGGMERVMSELAKFFSCHPNIRVMLITLTKGEVFFNLPKSVIIYQPNFKISEYPRLLSLIKTFIYLRKHLKKSRPDKLLSFGGKYNSFVILASAYLSIDIYISDRSKPGKSYGKLLDFLNPLLYKKTSGIIAQTTQAKEIISQKTQHKNIRIIGNPIPIKENIIETSENIILNVGRFISSKQQGLLLDFFAKLKLNNWKLIFLGDGPMLKYVKELAIILKIQDKVEFPGLIKDVDSYYRKSKIFAFTSNSEGFPNALGEAMAFGLACISFNCLAGPSDLIDDGDNGFLVQENDYNDFVEKLRLLVNDSDLRLRLGRKAIKKARKYCIESIGNEYLLFLTS